MKVETSKKDGYTKLLTYDNGVQYIVVGTASWLVGVLDGSDQTGNVLKGIHFFEQSSSN